MVLAVIFFPFNKVNLNFTWAIQVGDSALMIMNDKITDQGEGFKEERE